MPSQHIILEAICRLCGETFCPHSTDYEDLIHGQREDGEECYGMGVLQGAWMAPPEQEPAVYLKHNPCGEVFTDQVIAATHMLMSEDPQCFDENDWELVPYEEAI